MKPHHLPGSRFLLFAVFTALLVVGGIAMERSAHGPERGFAKQKGAEPLRDGDIVFQHSGSMQCAAVAQATHSPYTHCGVIFHDGGRPMVWEAVGPVRRTPWAEWVDQGLDGHVVVKRLKDLGALTPAVIGRMKAAGERDMGKPYDVYFAPDTERIYCSELVHRIYLAGANIQVGEVERFGDMDFTGKEARRILKDRFGERFPADQPVITPASLFRSPLLVTVDSIGSAPAWDVR